MLRLLVRGPDLPRLFALKLRRFCANDQRTLSIHMRTVIICALLVMLSVFSEPAQLLAQQACHVPNDLIGNWEWNKSSDSHVAPEGRFSFRSELNGKATLLRFRWSWPRDKAPQEQLFVIYQEARDTSQCTIDVTQTRCDLTITCRSAVPPKYLFSIESQDEVTVGFYIPPPSMQGNPVPWFRATAHRTPSHEQTGN